MILHASARITVRTMAEAVSQLGGIPLDRIRLTPFPATEKDRDRPENKLCELIDGFLVAKAVEVNESILGVYLSSRILDYVLEHDLGVVVGPDGFFYLAGSQIRAPNVSFIPWDELPEEGMPKRGHSKYPPALIVEVLSPSNTTAEIDRKLREFFDAGTQLAWVVNPRTRSARIYTSAKRFKEIGAGGTLDGDKVLPGFKLPLAQLFAASQRRKNK